MREWLDCLPVDLVHPLLDIVEGFGISHIIHDYNSVSAAVVTAGNCSESFLASGVPLIFMRIRMNETLR